MHKGHSREKTSLFQSHGLGDSSEGEIPEEIENIQKPLAKDSAACTSQKHDQPETSWRKEALEAERKAKSTIREALEKEQRKSLLLRKALRRAQKANATLLTSLKSQKARKDGLRLEMELMSKHLDEMLERQRRGRVQLSGKLRKMTAKREQDKKAVETLKKDLAATLHQHKTQMAALERVTCDQVQKVKEQLTNMQEESAQKDAQMTSLRFNTQTLQREIQAKGATIYTLQRKVSQLASEREELRRQSCLKAQARAKLATQKKTAALDESLAADESLPNQRELVHKMLLRHRTQVRAIALLSYEQAQAAAASDGLKEHIRSLRAENACAAAKYQASQAQYGKVSSQYHSVSQRCKELASANDDLLFEKRALAAQLRHVEDKLRLCQLECGAAPTRLQKALEEEKERCSELEERAARAARALRKERSIFEKHGRALDNAWSEQMQLVAEKQTLSVALRNALDANLRLKKQREEEAAST